MTARLRVEEAIGTSKYYTNISVEYMHIVVLMKEGFFFTNDFHSP